MNAAIAYTVGVKRRFGLFYKKYSVWGHQNVDFGGSTGLFLRLSDSSTLTIPDIHKKLVKVYSDYSAAIYNQNLLKQQAPPVMRAAIEDLTDGLREGQ